jgi:hypothetical protein
MQDTTSIWKETHNVGDSDWISDLRTVTTKEGGSSTLTSDANTDDSECNNLE